MSDLQLNVLKAHITVLLLCLHNEPLEKGFREA